MNNYNNNIVKLSKIDLCENLPEILLFGIDYRYFDTNFSSWKNSSIRKWLNNEFGYTTFRNCELEMIDDTYSGYNLYLGETYYDKVFLLYKEEAEELLESEMKCEFTEWVINTYNLSDRACSWWLRSPGEPVNNKYICSVDANGKISESGNLVTINSGIRPAIRIKLK
jgi:hypothetical protein